MKFARSLVKYFAVAVTSCCMLSAQSGNTPVAAVVPRLVNYSGKAVDAQSRGVAGAAGITFSIYREQTGGAPLWLETQKIQIDAKGNYTAQLGATTSEGLPLDLFNTSEPRWLGARVNGGEEQARVLLLSVPYALKAADAETVGGLPASAFMLAAPLSSAGIAAPGSAPTSMALPPASVTGSGTADFLPLWTGSSALTNSVLFQSGSGSAARIGINTTTPAATLDVTGGATIRGLLNLPAAAGATASAGADSRPFGLVASTFNSTSKVATNQVFHWQAEPVSNNTASPSATLNLLFSVAPAAAAETGLKINHKGQITFASGQTFPGTGAGTITGVTAGTDLIGGGTSGNVTLKLDTTKVPQLNAANGFTQPQSVTAVNPSGGALSANNTDTGNTTFGVAGTSASGSGYGVYGAVSGSAAVGAFGQAGTRSSTGTNITSVVHSAAVGIWGDGGTTDADYGVIGTADNGPAGVFVNNSDGFYTLVAVNENSAGLLFHAENTATGAGCSIDGSADLTCSGAVTGTAVIGGGTRKVALAAIESPKNWFEDFGSAKLVNGVAVVTLDPDFLETVNTEMDYKIFPVPNGDCKGLYVTRKTATSFEVRELGGGASSVSFDYRITALRKKFESVRFADRTHDPDALEQIRQRKDQGTANHASGMNRDVTRATSVTSPAIKLVSNQ